MSSTRSGTPVTLGRLGLGLLAGAVALGVLVYLVLTQEHVRIDRDGGYHYWNTYPLGETTAWATMGAAVVLGGVGVLCLVLAAFLGPEPVWRVSRDGRRRTLPAGFVVISVPIALSYGLLSLPMLGEESIPWALLVGVTCGIAAFRASSYAVAVVLGALSLALVVVGSGPAVILLGHGALAIGVVALIGAAVRSERWWVGVLAAALALAGLLSWLYLWIAVVFIVGCEYGGACLS